MSIFHNLRLRFFPVRKTDSEFGRMTYMYISNAPHLSYWEGEWLFPATGELIGVSLPGDENGAEPKAREFFRHLSQNSERILIAIRPVLSDLFTTRLQQDLPEDIFTVLRLTGIGLEDLSAQPARWEVSLETTGAQWLGITIPFEGEVPQPAIVDS
jgi:hypothetical protein